MINVVLRRYAGFLELNEKGMVNNLLLNLTLSLISGRRSVNNITSFFQGVWVLLFSCCGIFIDENISTTLIREIINIMAYVFRHMYYLQAYD